MATVAYTTARLLLDGAELSASLNELTLNYEAEMLDETCFGDSNRVYKGGLFHASIDGKGLAEFGGDGTVEYMLYNGVGTDCVVALFPVAITEGETSGYAMQAVGSDFNMGGTVGDLLEITFSFEGRGVKP